MTRLLLLLITLCFGASCPQPKIKPVPFEGYIPENGKAHGEFLVNNKKLYAVEINYKYSSAPGDRERIWQLSEGNGQGAPFTVKARITGSTGEPHHFEAIHPKLSSWGSGHLHAEVARMELAPGRYAIDLQLVDGRMPPGVPATFSVRRAYVGK